MTYTVNQYSEFKQIISSFGKAEQNLLVIVSDGGLGKTFTVETTLKQNGKGKAHTKKDYFIVKGHCTPKKLYEELYHHRNELIILDDVDALLSNPVSVAILKQACDTTAVKEVQYNTTQKGDVPSMFKTKSKMLLLLNRLPSKNENVMAFLSRGLFINFCPSPKEIFTELISFAHDKKITEFISKNIKKLSQINFRIYKHAFQLKSAGLNWERYLLEQFQLRDLEEVAIQVTETRKPYAERIAMWKLITGKGQSSYDRLVMELGSDEYLTEKQ